MLQVLVGIDSGDGSIGSRTHVLDYQALLDDGQTPTEIEDWADMEFETWTIKTVQQ